MSLRVFSSRQVESFRARFEDFDGEKTVLTVSGQEYIQSDFKSQISLAKRNAA